MGDTGNVSPEKTTALGVMRLMLAAETDYFHRVGHYATFADLVTSGQLGKSATDASENLRAFFALNLKSDSDPVPGFVLTLDVPAEGTAYKLSLEQRTNACSFRLVTDEKAVVFEGKSAACGSEEADSTAPTDWAPPDIDASVPTVRGDGPCPLPTIMQETKHRALELSDNLQKFSATERIEHRDVGKNGKVHNPTVGDFSYVAELHQTEHGETYIDEYRSSINGARESLAPVVDTGTAGFALIFHPAHIDEFAFTCEGLAEIDGRPAWQVRFAQRPDRRNDFHAYRVKGELYQVSVKGRAWVASDSYEVVRMESDLIQPIAAIDLQTEHQIIEYGPVNFQKRHLSLWLPQSATLYIGIHGHRYQRTHLFSKFELFSVDTFEKVKDPPADQDEPTQGPAMGLLPASSDALPPVPANKLPITPK